jgi:LysR family glycine cleavage system transcriptional activator
VEALLRDGSLVAPFALSVPSPHAYDLVVPEAVADVPAVQALRGWLLREAAASPKGRRPRPAR